MQQKLEILHIEDDDDVANPTRKVLQLYNPTWHIERVDNLDAGLDLLKASPNKFKLVILDLRLPGGYSGVEGLKLIVDSFPHICTVIYSGTSDPDMEDRAFHIGAQSYIYKPCDGQELYKKLNRAVIRFYGLVERCKVVEVKAPAITIESPLLKKWQFQAGVVAAVLGAMTTAWAFGKGIWQSVAEFLQAIFRK